MKGDGSFGANAIQVGLTHVNKKVEMNPNTFRKSVKYIITKNKDIFLPKINVSGMRRNKGNELRGKRRSICRSRC